MEAVPEEGEARAANTRTGKRKGSEWEILGNLEKGVSYTIRPRRHEGCMHKRRKWPLKGWTKRFFLLETGSLTYAKSQVDLARGRTLGKVNIGQAVISANYAEMRIDLDAEESVHHVRLDTMEQFGLFLEQLQQHRLSVQHSAHLSSSPEEEDEETARRPSLPPAPPLLPPHPSLARGVRPARAALIHEFAQQEERLVERLGGLQAQVTVLLESLGRVEEEPGKRASMGGKLFHLRRKKVTATKSSDRGSSPAPPSPGEEEAAPPCPARPTSLPAGDRPPREEPLGLALDLQAELASLQVSYSVERDHLRQLLECDSKGSSLAPSMAVTAGLRQALRSATEQNSGLRLRLARIHAESDLAELPVVGAVPDAASLPRGINPSLSYSSSCMSEFFDAREYAASEPDSEEEEEEEEGSEDSSPETETEEDNSMFLEAVTSQVGSAPQSPAPERVGDRTLTGRRRQLPVPQTETEGVNLWNLLCKNIGKDLSKISMPVTLNEPLSTLQRLCEELEYSDLVDKAVSAPSALDRMMWVAAFSISAYGSSNARASHKPFNPLLGETFECIREDRGFKYIAEQVSHHPPVSGVQATGAGWSWSQVLRIRSKFWGKSMEFQPEGRVTLRLEEAGEEYIWNKVTSCLHNLFGAERWVDLYGESIICCPQSGLSARIQFVKASYWSSKRHELSGTITDSKGTVLQNLFGKWSEGVYVGRAPSARCIWRPGSLPEDAELYYGFSRFALELNEVTAVEAGRLPPTDARLRPDQRALEEGRVAEAENIKLGVEQSQRDRRRQADHSQREPFRPAWFHSTGGDEGVEGEEGTPGAWAFSNTYWAKRELGFPDVEFEPLW
jgi:hypothetical protein